MRRLLDDKRWMVDESVAVGVLMALIWGLVVGAIAIAQTPPPVETCGTQWPKSEAELRAVPCPEGPKQWSQERAAGSCDWQPKTPQGVSCTGPTQPVAPKPPAAVRAP